MTRESGADSKYVCRCAHVMAACVGPFICALSGRLPPPRCDLD